MSADRALEGVREGADLGVEPLEPAQPLDFSNLPVYLTPGQAAEYLGFTADCERPVRAFLSWAERQHLPKRHRGRRLLFLRADCDRAVNGHDFLAEAAAAYQASPMPGRNGLSVGNSVNGRVWKPDWRGGFRDSQGRGWK